MGETRGRAGGEPVTDGAPRLESGICTHTQSTHTNKTLGYTSTFLYKDTRTRPYASESTASSMYSDLHTHTHANMFTRSLVPGPIPFMHKFKDMFTCALTYQDKLRRVSTLRILRMLTCCTRTPAHWPKYTFIPVMETHTYYTRLWDWGRSMGTHSRCGVGTSRCRDVSWKGGDIFPPSAPRPQETGSWGSTPEPPTGKSLRLQAFGGGGLPTAGMSPQKPPGESAVASVWVENPKVAPGWGRGRGREMGLAPQLAASPGLERPL